MFSMDLPSDALQQSKDASKEETLPLCIITIWYDILYSTLISNTTAAAAFAYLVFLITYNSN